MKTCVQHLLLVTLLSPVMLCTRVSENPLDASEGMGFLFVALLSSRPSFVAVGGNCTYWRSNRGASWDTATFPGCSGAQINGVAYGNGMFVAVGALNAAAGCGIWTSPNANTWTQQSCGMTTPPSAIAYIGPGKGFVIGGSCEAAVQYPTLLSEDGMTWRAGGLMNTACAASTVSSIVKSPISDTWIAAQTNSSTAYKSSDSGVSWTTVLVSPTLTVGPVKLTTQSNRIIGCFSSAGNSACQYTADDAATAWTSTAVAPTFPQPFNGVTVGQDTLVGVGPTCNVGFSTNAGSTMNTSAMTTGCPSIGIDWKAITYSAYAGMFVAGGNKTTGQNEVFAFSPTPTNWTILDPRENSNPITAIASRQ